VDGTDKFMFPPGRKRRLALLRSYAPLIVIYLPTFRDSLSAPSSRILDYLILEDEIDR